MLQRAIIANKFIIGKLIFLSPYFYFTIFLRVCQGEITFLLSKISRPLQTRPKILQETKEVGNFL